MTRTTFAAALLAATFACTDQPFARQVQAGSSITLTLTQFVEGTAIGFGSTLAGADAQRGRLSFVLCREDLPNCDPSPTQNPRQGYRLETAYATRLFADSLAKSGEAGAGIATAAINIPASGPDRPLPGNYLLEGRVTLPNGGEQLAVSRRQPLTIVEGTGTPTTFAVPGQEQTLLDAVPPPALRLILNDLFAARPAAIELRVRYPASVTIVGASGLSRGNLTTRFRNDTAARIVTITAVDVARLSPGLALGFRLLPGASAVSAADFTVVSQQLYDLDGNGMPAQSIRIDGIE